MQKEKEEESGFLCNFLCLQKEKNELRIIWTQKCSVSA